MQRLITIPVFIILLVKKGSDTLSWCSYTLHYRHFCRSDLEEGSKVSSRVPRWSIRRPMCFEMPATTLQNGHYHW
ncbi:hypothetical protein Plhal304r1_c022g0077471 [Plasmopara halstedii]